MPVLSFATGNSALVTGRDPLTELAFGARYISFDNRSRFLAHTERMDLGLIAWPGGHLAEVRTDRYGLEHDGLYAEWTGKPGLDEMMELAIAHDSALAVTIPTIRYLGRESDLETDLDAFLQTLLSGSYGPLPKELILQVGSEFYHYFDGPDAAATYGGIAATIVNTICRALADPGVNTIGADLQIAVQMGRTLAEDDLVRSGMCEQSLSRVAYLVHNHFTFQPDNADREMDDILASLERWDDANREAGGDGTGFFFAAYNIGQWTREGVLAEWLALQQADGLPITDDDVDLAARTNTDFEAFWQQRLSEGAYGLEHATVLIELFSVHAELGATAAAVFGIDTVHPGRLSWREDGQDHLFVGAEMIAMLYESVRDTIPLGTEEPYHKDNPVTAWGFENDDKLVVFLAAGQRPPGEVVLDIDGLGETYRSVFADGLTAEIQHDWMEVFGIPDNPLVDETPEAQTYAKPVRSAVSATFDKDGISLSLDAPFEIVRLAFAKTDAGRDEIASWTSARPLDLILPPPIPPDPRPEDPDGTDDDPDTPTEDGSEGAGFALALFALLPLLLLVR